MSMSLEKGARGRAFNKAQRLIECATLYRMAAVGKSSGNWALGPGECSRLRSPRVPSSVTEPAGSEFVIHVPFRPQSESLICVLVRRHQRPFRGKAAGKSMTATINAAQNGEPGDLPRVSTGSDGLDDILGGGFDANRMYLYEGRPGTGKTTHRAAIPARGRPRRRARALHHAVRDKARAEPGRAAARLVAGRRRHLRTGPARDDARSGARADRIPSCRDGAERNHQADLQGGRADQSRPRGARQPLRAAPAGAEPAALPPPGSGPEAFLHQPQLHGRAARRSLLVPGRPAASFHRARRGDARAARHRLRRRAAAAARDQDARHPVSRRLPRFHDRKGRTADLSAPDRGRASQAVSSAR